MAQDDDKTTSDQAPPDSAGASGPRTRGIILPSVSDEHSDEDQDESVSSGQEVKHQREREVSSPLQDGKSAPADTDIGNRHTAGLESASESAAATENPRHAGADPARESNEADSLESRRGTAPDDVEAGKILSPQGEASPADVNSVRYTSGISGSIESQDGQPRAYGGKRLHLPSGWLECAATGDLIEVGTAGGGDANLFAAFPDHWLSPSAFPPAAPPAARLLPFLSPSFLPIPHLSQCAVSPPPRSSRLSSLLRRCQKIPLLL
eukprot:879809-Rhodomonas_salina.1